MDFRAFKTGFPCRHWEFASGEKSASKVVSFVIGSSFPLGASSPFGERALRSLLLAMGRADAAVHVGNYHLRRVPVMNLVDPHPVHVGQGFNVRVDRPIWLVEAACLVTALPPTIHRMAGSRPRRSVSFTSSYPPRRPKTDWRNCLVMPCNPFLPVRLSRKSSPATSVSSRASSSSR